MLRALSVIVFLLVAFLLIAPLNQLPAEAQEKPGQGGSSSPESVERFNGAVRIHIGDPKGQTQQVVEVRVAIHNWLIGAGAKLSALPFPVQGLVVAQLSAGSLTTILDGKRQERREHEFWTVPSEKQLGVETGKDAAIIQTVVISKR